MFFDQVCSLAVARRIRPKSSIHLDVRLRSSSTSFEELCLEGFDCRFSYQFQRLSVSPIFVFPLRPSLPYYKQLKVYISMLPNPFHITESSKDGSV